MAHMNRSFFGRWIPIRNRSIFGGPSCTVPQWFGCISPIPQSYYGASLGPIIQEYTWSPNRFKLLDWNTKIWYANLCRDNAKLFGSTPWQLDLHLSDLSSCRIPRDQRRARNLYPRKSETWSLALHIHIYIYMYIIYIYIYAYKQLYNL